MRALTRLQSTVMFQAAGIESVSAAMTQRAKTLITFGVLVAAAMTSSGAHAQQQGPWNPSNCAAVGASVGGLAGSQSGNTYTRNAIGAALGALGGAVAGNWLCGPRPEPSRAVTYQAAPQYSTGGGLAERSHSASLDRPAATPPLSFSERERLDQMSKEAIDAKFSWKKSLWDIEQAKRRGQSSAAKSSLEQEAQARHQFEQRRATFATAVARLSTGSDGAPARAVGRYLEISSSLLELSTDRSVTYEILEARDLQMKQRSPAYFEEAERVARIRNGGGRGV